MVHLMKLHLNVNMNQNEVELLKMHSLMEKHLIEIALYKSQNMSILDAQAYKVIMYYQWMLLEKILVKTDVIVS